METKDIRILGIGAHGADVLGRSGGTLARYAQLGCHITVLGLSYGERGEAGDLWKLPGMTMEEVKRVKSIEGKKAAKILGIDDYRVLDFDDNPIEMNRDRLYQLIDIIREVKPNIVLTHWLDDWGNWDHAETGQNAVKAAWSASRPGVRTAHSPHKINEIYMFMPSGLSDDVCQFRPDILIDITDTMDIKRKAINCFQSQTEAIPYYTEDSPAYRGKQAGGVKYAEAFTRFTRGFNGGSLKFLPCAEFPAK